MPTKLSEEVDFFVSYTGSDKAWAEWIAWQLEHHGYRVLIQAWDFKSGGVFPGDMHRALQKSVRVLAVLSPAYMQSGFCQPEWQAAFADDPTGEKGTLVCIRVSNFKPDGLLRGRTYIDLVGLSDSDASTLLLSRLEKERGKPASAPAFPGSTVPTPPIFPGAPAAAVSPPPVLRTFIPHNLPTLQPFFGREEELKKIADALDPENRGWGALIDGPGGMGKTSLAVRAAYEASPDHFKKIAFVSLKARELDDDGVRDLSGFLITGLAELFNELARELGHADIAKAPEDQRPRLLLDALRGTQTLLVLDNLESLIKVERDCLFTFVKKLPQGCKAILTSRGRIGSGAEELILTSLSQVAALATLAELATHNPHLARTSEAERITLYAQTGGKPLLLRWTAGQLGRGHCLTFTDALFFLRSCPAGNDPLEFIFGDLIEDFSPEEMRVLSALTYFTQLAKVEHIVDLVDMGESLPRLAISPNENEAGLGIAIRVAVDRALRSLSIRSLVVPSDELQAFTLVPLVADFLRKKRPEVVAETGERLEERSYALIIENGYKQHHRFPVLDAAWPIVAAALPRFLAGKNDRFQFVCSALDDFLNFTGRWDEQLAISQEAEAKALAVGNLERAGRRAYDAGWIHFLRGQSAEVLACAGRAEICWEKAQTGVREKIIAISLRGQGHCLAEDYPAAIAAFREAVDLSRTLSPESDDVTIILNCLANAERGFGDFTAAEQDYREALRIAQAIDNHEGVAIYMGNLADVAFQRKDWSGAETLVREALSLARKIGRQELIASNCRRLAQILLLQGQKKEAIAHVRCAVEIFTKLRSPSLAGAQIILQECER